MEVAELIYDSYIVAIIIKIFRFLQRFQQSIYTRIDTSIILRPDTNIARYNNPLANIY